MTEKYQLADLCVVSESPMALSSFTSFLVETTSNADVHLHFCSTISTSPRKLVCRQSTALLYSTAEGWLYESLNTSPQIQLTANRDYTELTVCLSSAQVPVELQQEQAFLQLLRIALECRMAFNNTLSLHSACVAFDGQAVAFTAPSGTGKSTRAVAWVEGIGAQWVSGDRPALRMTPQGITAHGVPWDGKEQVFSNLAIPLLAICEVRRADSDFVRLRRLNAAQARAVLMQQCFVPMWDTNATAAAFATIRKLISGAFVPIYRMFCGQDVAAARTVQDILYHHPEQIMEALPDMKIKDGFTLRDVAGEYMVMPTGDKIESFGGTLILNETGAFFWDKFQDPVAREDVLDALLAEYDVAPAAAEKDLDKFLEQLRSYGVLKE